MICPVTDRPCTTNGCGEKCYKKDSLGYSVNPPSGIKQKGMTELKNLKSKLAKLKHLRSRLPMLIDCSQIYGDNYYTQQDLIDCNDKISEIEKQIEELKTK